MAPFRRDPEGQKPPGEFLLKVGRGKEQRQTGQGKKVTPPREGPTESPYGYSDLGADPETSLTGAKKPFKARAKMLAIKRTRTQCLLCTRLLTPRPCQLSVWQNLPILLVGTNSWAGGTACR